MQIPTWVNVNCNYDVKDYEEMCGQNFRFFYDNLQTAIKMHYLLKNLNLCSQFWKQIVENCHTFNKLILALLQSTLHRLWDIPIWFLSNILKKTLASRLAYLIISDILPNLSWYDNKNYPYMGVWRILKCLLRKPSSVFKECFGIDFFSLLIFVGGYQRPITGSEEKISQTTGQTYHAHQ